jgi:hypothetical protein
LVSIFKETSFSRRKTKLNSKEIEDPQIEFNQCNVEWHQTFKDQEMEIDKLKEKIQGQDEMMFGAV